MVVRKKFEKVVAVLFGGRSSEHEVSLRSALFILKNMPEKYGIVPVGINRDGMFFSLEGVFQSDDFANFALEDLVTITQGNSPFAMPNIKNQKTILLPYVLDKLLDDALSCDYGSATDKKPYRILNFDANCIFPVLHGQNGEDGRFQGLLELAEIAYVGCDLRSSVVGIDKDIQKRLARDAGVAVANYCVVQNELFFENKNQILEHIEQNISYPCFVKPNALGSAVGTGKAHNRIQLEQLLHEALMFDQKALVEEIMVGTEVECAFLGSSYKPRISIAGEIAPKDFYSYAEKYDSSSEAALFIPARLSSEKMHELQNNARKIALATGISGLCRIDFWNCKNTNKFVFNEINTMPGLTSISMFPKLWEQEGVFGKSWIEELIEAAYQRKKRLDNSQYGIKATT